MTTVARLADIPTPVVLELARAQAMRKSQARAAAGGEGEDRSVTVQSNYLRKGERALAKILDREPAPARPRVRGDCEGTQRPCPWVGCSEHLYLEPGARSIKFNFPQLELEDLAETCALDVADRGGVTLEEAGKLLQLTRERVRQIEVGALSKLRMHSHGLGTDDSDNQ